jgi:hypothetical protein
MPSATRCLPENMRFSIDTLPDSLDRRLDLLQDEELVLVLDYIEKQSDFFNLLGTALREAFDAVIDFPNTGRWGITDDRVQQNEKTFVGTKMEKRLERLLWTPSRGEHMDLALGGVDTDVKFTLSKFNSWMIPREAYRSRPLHNTGHLCLCVYANDRGIRPKYDAVLIRAAEHRMTAGGNQDGKRTFTATSMLEDGVLLQAGAHYRSSILAHLSPVQVRELYLLDGSARLVRAAEMIVEDEIPVSLHPSDILLLARSSRADVFIDAAHEALGKAGLACIRSSDGAVTFHRIS